MRSFKGWAPVFEPNGLAITRLVLIGLLLAWIPTTLHAQPPFRSDDRSFPDRRHSGMDHRRGGPSGEFDLVEPSGVVTGRILASRKFDLPPR